QSRSRPRPTRRRCGPSATRAAAIISSSSGCWSSNRRRGGDEPADALAQGPLSHRPSPARAATLRSSGASRAADARGSGAPPAGHPCVTAPHYHIPPHHPGDFFRYTRQGLEALCAAAGLRVVAAWATGGALLVVFHAIELNLPPKPRIGFVALTYGLFDWLDGRLTGHGNRPGAADAKGWALLAAKP